MAPVLMGVCRYSLGTGGMADSAVLAKCFSCSPTSTERTIHRPFICVVAAVKPRLPSVNCCQGFGFRVKRECDGSPHPLLLWSEKPASVECLSLLW